MTKGLSFPETMFGNDRPGAQRPESENGNGKAPLLLNLGYQCLQCVGTPSKNCSRCIAIHCQASI